MNQTYAQLTLFSNSLSGKDITDKLQLPPSSRETDGTYVTEEGNDIDLKKDLWVLKSTLSPNHSLQAHLAFLAQTLDTKRDALSQLGQDCLAVFSCHHYSSSLQEVLTLNATLLKSLFALPTDISIDMRYLAKELP